MKIKLIKILSLFAAYVATLVEKFENGSTQETFSFGVALELAKQNIPVQRKGWNGKNMYIFCRPEYEHPTAELSKIASIAPEVLQKIQRDNENRGIEKTVFTPYLCMYAADGSIVNGWLVSQTDVNATDWQIAA